MGSKGKGSAVAAQVAQNLNAKQEAERLAARDAANRPPVGVAARENYRAPDPWRKRTLMDQLSPQTTNAGRTLLG